MTQPEDIIAALLAEALVKDYLENPARQEETEVVEVKG